MIDRITTRVSEILRIRYPIMQAGMVWASGHRLAAACAEADILGTIGAGSMKQDFLREEIRKARALTKKRLAVNIPLLRTDAAELLEISLEEDIDTIILKVAKDPDYSAATEAALIQEFKESVGAHNEIRVEYVVSIPQERSGKFRFAISKVPNPFG